MANYYWVYGPVLDIDGSRRNGNGPVRHRRRQFDPTLLSRTSALSSRLNVLPEIGTDAGGDFNMDTEVSKMTMLRARRVLAAGLAVLMALMTVPMGLAQAKMVTTDEVISQSAPDNDRERVRGFLLREDVQKQLTLLGVDPEEAAQRIASLTDEEIDQIAGRLDELPAGEGVGTVVGAILIIFLVLLITDILGLTDVFPFVRR